MLGFFQFFYGNAFLRLSGEFGVINQTMGEIWSIRMPVFSVVLFVELSVSEIPAT